MVWFAIKVWFVQFYPATDYYPNYNSGDTGNTDTSQESSGTSDYLLSGKTYSSDDTYNRGAVLNRRVVVALNSNQTCVVLI